MSGGILPINIFFTFYWCYLQEVLSVSGRLLQTQQKLQTIILIPQALLSLLLALEITQLTSELWITISQSFKRHLEWSSSMLKEEVDFEVLHFFLISITCIEWYSYTGSSFFEATFSLPSWMVWLSITAPAPLPHFPQNFITSRFPHWRAMSIPGLKIKNFRPISCWKNMFDR